VAARAAPPRVTELNLLVRSASAGGVTQDRVPAACQLVRGHVARLSTEHLGCFLVQALLEQSDKAAQKELVGELRGHVGELLESQHGNHVLQKAVEIMPPPVLCFLLPELKAWGSPRKLATHKYGCRVLERVIEHFPMPDLLHFIEDILDDSVAMSKEPFGNFVMQHILEHGNDDHRHSVAVALGADLRDTATHPNACLVLNKVLTYAAHVDQKDLAERVIAIPGLVADMAGLRNGFAATLRLFVLATGQLLEAAHLELAADANRIWGTKHGRALLDAVTHSSPAADSSDDEHS